MNRYQILEVIETLAKSQGFYGRLLESINDATEEQREAFFTELEEQGFVDAVDLVMYLEG